MSSPRSRPSRLALLIDAGYLEKLCQETFAERQGVRKVPLALDFKRLSSHLAGGRPWRTFYYHCLPFREDPPLPAEEAAYQAKQRFVGFLRTLPRWELREGVVERRGGFREGDTFLVQKRVDVMLAVDLVRLAWTREIDRAVVIAGDSDFVPAIADARAAGVHVTLRYHPGTAHHDLIVACNEGRLLTREGLAELRLST